MFTSTTAPGKSFASRAELAEHYKSDWHKYNLKRREAGLSVLTEPDFRTRWEAALALRKEKESKGHTGVDHLKNKQKGQKQKTTTDTKKQNNQSGLGQKASETPTQSAKASGASSDTRTTETSGTTNLNTDSITTTTTTKDPTMTEETTPNAVNKSKLPAQLIQSQENPSVDPKQSLFDSHISSTLQANVDYMQKHYGFFIPDQECLFDLEGLLGYCQEKIKLGHYCLYCEKMFPTWQGAQQHMIHKQHAKLRYEQGYWDELDPFYDFKRENGEFGEGKEGEEKSSTNNNNKLNGETATKDIDMDVDANDDDDEDWEDVSEGDEEEDDDDKEVFDGYEKEIARFGLDVTPLGELVFPDGRIIGHRALNRYYKQNLRPANQSTAIVAAKRAAGERLYEGRVVNIGQPMPQAEMKSVGKGILVALKDGVEGFSALSLYRYRAAVRKQRRDDDKGRRLQFRTTQNINRMDKKANRLMNGVSVAHAAR